MIFQVPAKIAIWRVCAVNDLCVQDVNHSLYIGNDIASLWLLTKMLDAILMSLSGVERPIWQFYWNDMKLSYRRIRQALRQACAYCSSQNNHLHVGYWASEHNFVPYYSYPCWDISCMLSLSITRGISCFPFFSNLVQFPCTRGGELCACGQQCIPFIITFSHRSHPFISFCWKHQS